MFNIRAGSINHFTTTPKGDDNSFSKQCLAAFKKTILPCVAHYVSTPTNCTQITFTSQETSRTLSSSSSSSSSSSEELAAEYTESIIEVPKNVMAILQGKPFTGVYYAYLMTHSLYGKKTSAHVGYSTNPMYDVYLHNTLAFNDRTTSAAAPHWILDMVLGAFLSVELAIECTKEWVSHTRGKESKRKKAYFLSRIYKVPLYSAAVKPSVTLREYLTVNAPPKYTTCYEQMIASPASYNLSRHSLQQQKKKQKRKKVGGAPQR